MDQVTETPPKKLRPYQAADNDSIVDLTSDELDEELPLETLPATQLPSSPYQSTYITQPTQLLEPGAQHPHSRPANTSSVQVPASSPTRPVPHTSSSPSQPRIAPPRLQSLLAPPGTAYRAPPGVQKPAPQPTPTTIDVSSDDEGPRYHGNTSEDDDTQQAHRDIKPSVLKSRSNPHAPSVGGRIPPHRPVVPSLQTESERRQAAMRDTLQKYRYDQPQQQSFILGLIAEVEGGDGVTSAKRPASDMAGAYGSASRPAKAARRDASRDASATRQAPSSGPPGASSPLAHVQLETPTPARREKLRHLKFVLPGKPDVVYLAALQLSKDNVDDAMARLTSDTSNPELALAGHDDDNDDDDDVQFVGEAPKQAATKQELQRPARTLQQKYVSTQARNTGPKPTSPKKAPVSSLAPAPPTPAAPVQEPGEPKKRKRLMRGRRDQAVEEEDEAPPAKARKLSVSTDPSSPLDSGVASVAESSSEKVSDGSLLGFFNTCSQADLCDLANIQGDVADLILSQRPFRNIDQIRRIEQPATQASAAKGKNMRKATRKRLAGDKIVDESEKMWDGYRAVDGLVDHCKRHGETVVAEMKKWNIDVFGTKKKNVDLVGFAGPSDSSSLRDSGIGTPADTDSDTSPHKASSEAGQEVKDAVEFYQQPAVMPTEIVLKDYQLVGMNWLALLYRKNLSCILADEMGLGKTCQVIAFFAHLMERGIDNGPHLVVVPASTIENWMREFERFCPALAVYPYHGLVKERETARENIVADLPDVIVTTYGIAKLPEDRKFLNSLSPNVCVYDEGHTLKNATSAAYRQLMQISCKFRLLLTGTPLQNNLSELTSLLGFILPSIFSEHQDDLKAIFGYRAKTTDEQHTGLLSAQRIRRARAMLSPFVLRRKKQQVLADLPKKTRRVAYCGMTDLQKELYEKELSRRRQLAEDREAGVKATQKGASTNILMGLRQAAIHARLRTHHYAEMPEAIIQEYIGDCSGASDQLREKRRAQAEKELAGWNDWYTHTWCQPEPSLRQYCMPGEPFRDSGKVEQLVALLKAYKANGDRCLIFSQFTTVLDILEPLLAAEGVLFYRLDGDTPVEARQDLIDGFTSNAAATAFLLSTRAGGAGINLAAANKVVIFDSSFNPQDDIQAENRAHRVGQVREVEVVRLVTRGTIEEQIHALGESKIALDERVAGEAEVGEEEAAAERRGMAEVEAMLDAAAAGEQAAPAPGPAAAEAAAEAVE